MEKLKESFHIAKLALFNVRVLSEVENARATSAEVDGIVTRVAGEFRVALPVSLRHQGSILGVLYLGLIWLWDQPGVREHADLHDLVATRIDLVARARIVQNRKPRPVTGSELLGAMRNATAHGRVVATETEFIFTDKNMRDPNDEISFALSWEDTARLAESVFWVLNDIIWRT